MDVLAHLSVISKAGEEREEVPRLYTNSSTLTPLKPAVLEMLICHGTSKPINALSCFSSLVAPHDSAPSFTDIVGSTWCLLETLSGTVCEEASLLQLHCKNSRSANDLAFPRSMPVFDVRCRRDKHKNSSRITSPKLFCQAAWRRFICSLHILAS